MANTTWQRHYPLLTPLHLAAEQGIMARTYPTLRLLLQGSALCFQGLLRTNWGSSFEVQIRLPPRYPEAEPTLRVLSPELPAGTQHRYVDGRICAHAAPFIAYRTTAAAMVSVLAGWLLRFERHRLYGVSWEEPVCQPGEVIQVDPSGVIFVVAGR